MNQALIDRINALQPCGAELRGILLALAGQAAEPAKPAAKYPDGTRWVNRETGTELYVMRDGNPWWLLGNGWSGCTVDGIDRDYLRIDVPAPTPTPAPAKPPTMPPCVRELVEDAADCAAYFQSEDMDYSYHETISKVNAVCEYYGEPNP